MKTFKRRTRGRLGTTREGSKTTREAAGVPSNFVATRILLKIWPVKLRDAPELDVEAFKTTRACTFNYKVLGGLSYGHPWSHITRGPRPCIDVLTGTTLHMDHGIQTWRGPPGLLSGTRTRRRILRGLLRGHARVGKLIM
jgi:hypothetical protein